MASLCGVRADVIRGKREDGRMFQNAWKTPVGIRLASGSRIVRTVAEATECLTEDWPVPHGSAFDAALQACLDCFEGHTPADTVRNAFVAASREANIFVCG
jgi:Protein of unknown function (DUF982)